MLTCHKQFHITKHRPAQYRAGTNAIIIVHADANEIMELLMNRFPQAQLEQYPTEEEMIRALKEWRRRYTDMFLKDINNVNVRMFTDDESDNIEMDSVLRFDTCINGYGMFH